MAKLINYHKLSTQDKLDICEVYSTTDNTLSDLARKYKVCVSTIQRLLIRRGITLKTHSEACRVFKLNETFFDIIDTETKAYFLGILYADGCNYTKKNKITIALKETDKKLIEDLSKLIYEDRPIMYIKRPEYDTIKDRPIKRLNQCGLNIVSKHMSNSLVDKGLVANKSLILKFPTKDQVPDHLIQHFIRGYFDGDGCITGVKGNYQQFSFMGSYDFLKELKLTLIDKLDLGNVKIHKHYNIHNLSYGGKHQLKKFRDWIYQDSTIYLERKHNRFYYENN